MFLSVFFSGRKTMPRAPVRRAAGRLLLALVAVIAGLQAQPSCPWCAPGGGGAPISLDGVIDMHVHSAPDSGPRSVDALQIARIARDAGMRAILLKNHYAPTAGLAFVVERAVPGIRVFGGVALNGSMGVNAAAVEHMAATTGGHGKVVWMPTFDSEHYHRVDRPNPNFVPVSHSGKLLPDVLEVLDLIAEHDLALATGHSSPEESLMLIREARKRGIDKILVTHPLPPPVAMPVEMQKEAARLGALLEYPVGTALAAYPSWKIPADERFNAYVEAMRAVGVENVVLSSDLGQPMNPLHTDGLVGFIGKLLGAGFTQADIDKMTKSNPARLLGL